MATFTTRCHSCADLYEAQRSTSRFCSNACRSSAGRTATLAALRIAASALLLDQTRAILDRQVAIYTGDIDALRDADRRRVSLDDRTAALFTPSPRRTARAQHVYPPPRPSTSGWGGPEGAGFPRS